MAEPTLTSSQISGLQDAIATANAGSSGSAKQIALLQANMASQANLENGLSGLFEYNNVTVIANYELERRSMDGFTVQSPITESDIQNFANQVPGNRLISGTSLPPSRIPQFDGSPLVYADPKTTADKNEMAQYAYQDTYTNLLIFGFSGGSGAGGITTGQPIDSSFSSVQTAPVVNPILFTVGGMIGISGGGNAAILKVLGTSSTSGVGGLVYTINFSYQVPPLGPIPAGSPIALSMPGFSNAERASKSSSSFQAYMNCFVTGLTNELNARAAALSAGIAAFNANGNDGKDAKALTEKQTSLSFIQGFLPTLDISDSGLSQLSVEENTRKTQITRRIGDIVNEIKIGYNGGSLYDRRYSLAAARCTLGNGSLYVLIQQQKQLASLSAGQATASALSQRWSSFLPPS